MSAFLKRSTFMLQGLLQTSVTKSASVPCSRDGKFIQFELIINAPSLHKSPTVKNGVFWDVTPCGTCKNIPEDTFLHSHRRENLKSYKTHLFLRGLKLQLMLKPTSVQNIQARSKDANHKKA
jgi:hypothetical protein